ncbi:SbcC family exonuclease [Lacticaseibacillus parakribbianus]|uniref:SbcC family exonuclease n=1 Tax=Lacticaseibacillus parakribbianus TaxID=2970927 RepID=UPI0021CB6B82|nr:SbcC family exonuclease [Lacticaseibacillus parakribbianus]
MTIQSSLNYQQKFFGAFAEAWDAKSTYRLYKGIDATADNLRLALSETPGYILAYDKAAQDELHDFLQRDLIAFLRQHVPFFVVADDGAVFFGDWYHRRQFGHIDVIARTITQATAEEQAILPQLHAFAEDPDHFLDHQLEDMRRATYQEVDTLHNQLEAATAESVTEPTRSAGSGFRGLLKNFIDPDEQTPTSTPQRRSPAAGSADKLRLRFDAAKAEADQAFDAHKRELQVAAAITRYEYQAVMATYSSVEQFENILTNLQADFMRALELKEEQPDA